MREIAHALQRRGRGELRGVRLRIVVVFPGQPEERPVLAVVEFRDDHRSAEAGAEGAVRLRRQGNAGGVIEVVVGRPTGLPHGAEQAAVPLVGARFQVRVEHAAAGARHFRVIGVGLNFHLFHGFQRRNDDRAIGRVGDRDSVQQVIVAPHRTARNRDLRRSALVFHAVVVRVAHRCHVLRQLRHHERIAPQVGEIHQLLAVQHLPLARVGGFHQRHLLGHLHALADRPDLHLEIERDNLLRGHNHVLALEFLEARRLGHQSISGRHHLAEAKAFRCGNGRPLPAAGLVHQRHLDLADGFAGAVHHRAANSPQIRLAP